MHQVVAKGGPLSASPPVSIAESFHMLPFIASLLRDLVVVAR